MVLGFSDEDKLGTIQPHDDALVVTLRINGYNVKRVMIDQGNAVEIMYPNLYKGLNLKFESLTARVLKAKWSFQKVKSDYLCRLTQMWLRWTLLW